MRVILIAAAAFCVAGHASAQEAASANQYSLPDGDAKQTIETVCVACHDLRRVVHSNYSQAEWHNVINMMVSAGAPLTPAQKESVTDYLIKNFPGKPKPAPSIIAGPVQVSFKEWPVPTPGSRPHDPLATPDGAIWYSGNMSNKIGRLDPATGIIKEYPLKTPFSGPHGLTYDKNGDIWFTANFASYVGKLNPATGDITEYKMPDPAARDPHTPLFDKDGVLWFTLQNANMVGRLDPKTGDIKLVTMPTPKSQPYGMVFTSDGETIFFDMFGTNKIASIDRKTMAIKEYPLPDTGSRPRRIAITSDDIIWYGDYSRGRLGRLDPKDRQGDRIPLARRPAHAALRHHRAPRHHLVRRIRSGAERAGALRSQDRKISDLGYSVGRRRGAQHDADIGRPPSGARLQRRQRSRPCRDQRRRGGINHYRRIVQ